MLANHFKSVYPYNQEVQNEYPLMDDKQLEAAMNKSAHAFLSWKRLDFYRRSTILKNVAQILRRDSESLAKLITLEMGKVYRESLSEIEKCAVTATYYADHAEVFLQDEKKEAGYSRSFICYQPLGVVLGIMPWNFPFWQVFRYAAPTLMAGNTTLLKHAPNVCGCALAIEKIFLEAGAPEGVLTTVIIDTSAIERVLASDNIQAVTLTGSERAGSSVASFAGQHIKKSVMELGGSDAFIVLSDANIAEAASVAVQSRMQNAGQSCIAAKRFIVLKNIMDEFMQEFTSRIRSLTQGDPFDEKITTGPMARLDLVQSLENQIKKSISLGAKLEYGGDVNGCNFKPGILTKAQKGMPACDEETFGPLAVVIEAVDESDAIQLANDSRYGLAGSVWTRDIEKGFRIAKEIQSGAVFVNTLVKSDARLPFGGIKKSGYGRELGRLGILEFVNAKTITGG